MSLEIHSLEKSRHIEIALQGRLDAYSHVSLNEELERLMNEGHLHFIIDCTQLQFVSSAGLSVFLNLVQRLRNHGKFVLCNAQPGVKAMVKTSGLQQFVPIIDNTASLQLSQGSNRS